MSSHAFLPRIVCIAAIALAAAGCSNSADGAKAGGSNAAGQGAAGGAARKAFATNPNDVELVSAVTKDAIADTDDQVFRLRFRLLARPEVSQPLQIELVMEPTAESQFVRLQLGVWASEGISLTGESAFSDSDLPTGASARHTITVLPQQAGVLQLHVNAVATTDKNSATRQFDIPLIAFGAQPAADAGP